MAPKSSANKPETSVPIRAHKTISLRTDFNERLREEAHRNKTTASALIEKALSAMWGLED
jgi:predicted DNA-binding ribbon-helix-helix protein